MLGWREIDFALISEASKIHPDFSKMEQLVRDGADVNAPLPRWRTVVPKRNQVHEARLKSEASQ